MSLLPATTRFERFLIWFASLWDNKLIGSPADPYLLRLILFKSRRLSVFVHVIFRSDDAPHLHDHPWRWAWSLLLRGAYTDTRPLDATYPVGARVSRRRGPGRATWFPPGTFHHLTLHRGPVWTLFVCGREHPRLPPRNHQDWGFAVENLATSLGWRRVHWAAYSERRGPAAPARNIALR